MFSVNSCWVPVVLSFHAPTGTLQVDTPQEHNSNQYHYLYLKISFTFFSFPFSSSLLGLVGTPLTRSPRLELEHLELPILFPLHTSCIYEVTKPCLSHLQKGLLIHAAFQPQCHTA